MIENSPQEYYENPENLSLWFDGSRMIPALIYNNTHTIGKLKRRPNRNLAAARTTPHTNQSRPNSGRTSFGQSCLLTHKLNQTEKSVCAASRTRAEAVRQQEKNNPQKRMLATETGNKNQNHETRNLGGSGNRWTTEAAPYRRDTRRQKSIFDAKIKADAQNLKTELSTERTATGSHRGGGKSAADSLGAGTGNGTGLHCVLQTRVQKFDGVEKIKGDWIWFLHRLFNK
jgi:hypothetical protein